MPYRQHFEAVYCLPITMVKTVKTNTLDRLGLLILTLLFFAVLFLFNGCKSEDPKLPDSTKYANVKVTFVPVVNGSPFYMDSVYNSDTLQDYKYYFELFKFYISDLKFTNSNGELLAEDVALMDFGYNVPRFAFEVNLEQEGSFDSVSMGIGLDPVQNASDPITFPADHPLSSSQGTHWDWTSMYRFIMIEGKIDTTNTGSNFNLGFAVHTGFNKNYRRLSFAKPTKLEKGKKYELTFEVDIHKILFNTDHPTDFRTNSVSHSDNALNTLLADNFAAAVTLK